MSRHIKMIGLDLDGTLLNSDKQITEHTKEVLKAAIDKGIMVLPATGRPLSGLPKEFMELPGIRYAMTANGARILDVQENKVLYENLVPYEVAVNLLDIFNKYDTLLEVYYEGIGYADQKKLENISHYIEGKPMAHYIRTTRRPVDNVMEMFRKEGRPSDKVQALFANQEERNAAAAEAEAMYPDAVELTWSLDKNIEVNAKGVSKGQALLRLGELFGIKQEEIMACGDGSNDIDMMIEAGLGVAMANAMPAVKEVADVITDTNDEDGVAKAIEKYAL